MPPNRNLTHLRRFGLPIVLAVLGAVSLTAGVFAATIKLKQIPTTAAGFDSKECTGPFKDLASDKDGWHFVVPEAQGDGFTSITLTFATSGGTVVAGPITSKDSAAPDSGAGWSGWLAAANNDYKHAYVITSAGWELTAASAVVVNEKKDGEFNLSHTCPGTPPSTPTPSPSVSKSPSSSPSPSTSPSVSPSVSPSPSTSPSTSPSPSPSVSPSASPSPSLSPSPSMSPSSSPSPSPSVSPSTSATPSPSASVSPSLSPSASESLSPSPEPGGELPRTGSSVSTVLIVAGLLLLAGAGLLAVGTRRRMPAIVE